MLLIPLRDERRVGESGGGMLDGHTAMEYVARLCVSSRYN